MIWKSDSHHRRSGTERYSEPQTGIDTAVVLFIMTFLVFRIEVSSGRAIRLSKSAHSRPIRCTLIVC